MTLPRGSRIHASIQPSGRIARALMRARVPSIATEEVPTRRTSRDGGAIGSLGSVISIALESMRYAC